MEGLLKEYPNTLILRVRMPIVEDLTYPRNFITKIIKYDKVCLLAINTVPHSAHGSRVCPSDAMVEAARIWDIVVDPCSETAAHHSARGTAPGALDHQLPWKRRAVTAASAHGQHFD